MPASKAPLLMDEKALRKRVHDLYRAMKTRAQPKLWKSGKRQGQVKTAGISALPFTHEDLWQHITEKIGPTGIAHCPYCKSIGRAPAIITLQNCVLDHHVPIARGGRWELSNIVCVCATCNREKGRLSYEFFIRIMVVAEQWPDKQDRHSFTACLRTHGVANRLRGFHGKKPAKVEAQKVAPTLALKDAW